MPESFSPLPSPDELTGTVQRVTYYNEETQYCVLRMETEQGIITAVGTLPAVVAGTKLALTGEWQLHPSYGRQFRVSKYRQLAPLTTEGIERYLGSGLVKGIGPALAKRLVQHFGLETLQVIAHDPQRLAEVPGLGAKRRADIQAALAAHQAIQDIMVFLQGLGASHALAARIYKRYGAQAVAVLQQNPYRLAEEVWGVGFLTADRLARSMGVSAEAPLRAHAAVMYLLQQAGNNGHMYLSMAELAEAGKRLGLSENLIRGGVARQAAVGRLVVEDEGEAVYLPRMWQAECETARRLKEIDAAGTPWPEELPGVSAPDADIQLSAEQQEAVAAARLGGVLIVTGGPGTGKTTIMRQIVRHAHQAGRRILLAAPTGRAAKRLAESTGEPARTIHRLLEFSPGQGDGPSFQRHAENPLQADIVIVDEVSMLDLPLACHLLRAVKPGTALVLVGDADQLPSVGPGNFLADVLASGVIRSVRLTHVFRQADAGMIVLNAHRINSGNMPLYNRHAGDFFFVEERSAEALPQLVRELVAVRLPKYLKCHPLHDIQTLTPVRRGPAGVGNLNRVLQAALNPQAVTYQTDTEEYVGASRFYPGDRVMQTRNNYVKMVFNGDIGQVITVDPDGGGVVVAFPDREDGGSLVYEADEIDELELAYAISVHKSQGSEYPAVVVPLVPTMPALMTRNLLYTAVTRAKKLVVLVGSAQALRAYVGNAKARQRNSRLCSRLVKESGADSKNGAGRCG